MDTLCDLFGRSRQAYYQRSKYNYKEEVKQGIKVVKNQVLAYIN
jgi:hypothetical protein